jgi:aspartyl-tRNA(Asn)/glutamyl-tRNA(Gln) amidotransferase subunit A
MPTTAASRMLENFIPEYESTVSQKLIDAGCVMLGKTNMDEFAMGGTGTTSYFGATINPHRAELKLSPGGSSSGSASAVAAHLCAAAIGTDTGSSIRFPAALTGLVGFKPSYGICSRFGCIAFASSLDHPGVLTRSADDAATMMSVMMGYDERESTSAKCADDIAKSLSDGINALPLAGIKIGVIREFPDLPTTAEIMHIHQTQIDKLKSAGATVVVVSVPHITHVDTMYNVISRAEASSNLARFDGMRYGLRIEGSDLIDTYKKTRAVGFGDYAKLRMLTGSVMLTADFYKDCFLHATKVRRILDNEFNAAFEQCDFIITPSSPCLAVSIDAGPAPEVYNARAMLHIGANMSGLPAVSVPIGMVDDLPVGLHIMGRRFDDKRVLEFAKAIEENR